MPTYYEPEPAGPRTTVPQKSFTPDGKEVITDCYGVVTVRNGTAYPGGALSPDGRHVSNGVEGPY